MPTWVRQRHLSRKRQPTQPLAFADEAAVDVDSRRGHAQRVGTGDSASVSTRIGNAFVMMASQLFERWALLSLRTRAEEFSISLAG
ncbi:MAG TPA: hypothetical protein VGC79_16375 [Polyangiaceae bacterium]